MYSDKNKYNIYNKIIYSYKYNIHIVFITAIVYVKHCKCNWCINP